MQVLRLREHFVRFSTSHRDVFPDRNECLCCLPSYRGYGRMQVLRLRQHFVRFSTSRCDVFVTGMNAFVAFRVTEGTDECRSFGFASTSCGSRRHVVTCS